MIVVTDGPPPGGVGWPDGGVRGGFAPAGGFVPAGGFAPAGGVAPAGGLPPRDCAAKGAKRVRIHAAAASARALRDDEII